MSTQVDPSTAGDAFAGFTLSPCGTSVPLLAISEKVPAAMFSEAASNAGGDAGTFYVRPSAK